MNYQILQKKINTAIVLLVSICFLFFSSANLYAQQDDGSGGDDTTDSQGGGGETDGDEAGGDSTDGEGDIDGTDGDSIDSEGADGDGTTDGTDGITDTNTQPVAQASSGGGSSGGALLGLVAVGAVVAVMASRNKTTLSGPTIQKTFTYDKDVTGREVFIMNFSEAETIDTVKSNLPNWSMQIGSDSYKKQPYSFINMRLTKNLNEKVSVASNWGAHFYSQADKELAAWQWLSLNMQANNVFSKKDRLSFIASYTKGDSTSKSRQSFNQADVFTNNEYLFLDENTRFKLDYSKSLVENQRLGFQLSKNDAPLNPFVYQAYRAQVVWQRSL